MADDAQQKTLPATPRKIRKAREDGQVARSRDLGHLVAIGGAGALIVGFGAPLVRWMQSLMGQSLRFDAAVLAGTETMRDALADAGLLVLGFALPLGAVLWLVAAAAGVLSGGWNFTLKALQPRLDKLDPLQGLKRMVAKDQLVTMAKASLLALVLLAVGASYLGLRAEHFVALLALPPERALDGAGELVVAELPLGVIELAVTDLAVLGLLARLEVGEMRILEPMVESALAAAQRHRHPRGDDGHDDDRDQQLHSYLSGRRLRIQRWMGRQIRDRSRAKRAP